MRTTTLEQFKKDAIERFGPDNKDWKFQCPSCGHSQSARDLINAGAEKDKVNNYIGFSCIGRWDEKQGCDWTLGGLFQIHKLEIETPDKEKHKYFDLAPGTGL